MAEYRRSEIVSGLFILLAVGVFGLFAFKVGGLDLFAFFRPGRIPCVTYFQDVKTLEEGVKVSIGGRRVGTVMRISLASSPEDLAELRDAFPVEDRPDWARGGDLDKQALKVEFELEKGASVRIDRASARISLIQDGLLGTHYLRLDPGLPAKAKAADTIERPLVLLPGPIGGLDMLLSEAPLLVEKIKTILEKVDDGILSVENQDAIRKTLKSFSSAGEKADEVLARFSSYVQPENEASLDKRVLEPAQQLLRNADQDLGRILAQVREVTLPRIDQLLQDGRDAVADARQVLQHADDAILKADERLQGVLENLKRTTADLDRRLDDLQSSIQSVLGDAGRAVGELRGILVEHRPDIAEMLQALRRIAWDVEILVRKVRANPAVVLWGDDEPILDPGPVDETMLRRMGRARPFGQREEGTDGK